MRKLLATTAILAVAATPLAAASDATPEAVTDAVAANDITVAQLINREVYVSPEGDKQVTWSNRTDVPDTFESSGEIEDLLLDKDGRINFAVIGKGGLLDIGDTEVQVDIGEFGVVMDADDRDKFYVVYTGSPSDLKDAQRYRGLADTAAPGTKNASDATRRTAGVGVNTIAVENASRGGVRGASNTDLSSTQMEMEAAGQDLMGYAARESGTSGAEARWTMTSARQTQRGNARRGSDYFGAAPTVEPDGFSKVSVGSVTADELEWAPVYTAGGEWVGRIGDLELGRDGHVSNAIVDMGGFLGIGETPVAVPFDKITLKRDASTGTLRGYVGMSESAIQRLRTEATGS